MQEVSKTLYIPLYGKALVSRKGVLLHDPRAEAIWQAEGFVLKGKAASKWLAYYMGMRAKVFDLWLKEKLAQDPDALVLHLGCGMDSRVCRVAHSGHRWYDVDFPHVIGQRKRHYEAMEAYEMIGADIRDPHFLDQITGSRALVVMEGISMYLTLPELRQLLADLNGRFDRVDVLMDCYTVFAAKASKYKNPVNDVGVTILHGLDDPRVLEGTGLFFLRERELTPPRLIGQLRGFERVFFQRVFAGKMAKKIYRLYEFSSQQYLE